MWHNMSSLLTEVKRWQSGEGDNHVFDDPSSWAEDYPLDIFFNDESLRNCQYANPSKQYKI